MAPEKVIHEGISIDAPVLKVWEALTKPLLMEQWLSDAKMKITFDWKTGVIIFRGHMHGMDYEDRGTILQFEPGKVLKYSYWAQSSRLADTPENNPVITFTLIPSENQTRLTLTHSNLVNEATYKHSEFYWKTTLGVIKRLIEKP